MDRRGTGRGRPLTRRELLTAAGGTAAAGALAGCSALAAGEDGRPVSRQGRPPAGRRPRSAATLSARPGRPPATPPPAPGERPLGLREHRDALLHVPAGLRPDRPVPLVVALHGAGGDAAGGLALVRPLADRSGLCVLAPASLGPTWDAVRGTFGVDVHAVDRALERVFGLVAVDPARTAVAGFSDGASYALGLGLANGRLLSRVIAFSPGFVPAAPRTGQPSVFVSHGDDDDVLPIGRTSRWIVPALRADGYEVTYREFHGPHAVPPEVAQEAVDWLGWPSRTPGAD